MPTIATFYGITIQMFVFSITTRPSSMRGMVELSLSYRSRRATSWSSGFDLDPIALCLKLPDADALRASSVAAE